MEFKNLFAAMLSILFFGLVVFIFVIGLNLNNSIVAALVVQAMNSSKDLALLAVKAVYGLTNEQRGN